MIIGDKNRSNSEIQLFLYKFIRHVCAIISDENKNSFLNNIDYPELENKYRSAYIMIDFLKNTLSLLNKNKNISKELKHKMICSIVALFFSDVAECNLSLYNEEFISMVAEMIQKPELNIYLDKYKKNFFSYIKEQLLKVKGDKNLKNHLSVYIENKNRDSEIDKLQQDDHRISAINGLKQQLNAKATEINNLQRNINFYKWLYLFALIPVFGWIFCAILRFYFHKPSFNRLGQLTQDQQKLNLSKTVKESVLSYLEQLTQMRQQAKKQSEQLKYDCQILLNFIDSKKKMPPEHIIRTYNNRG